MQELTTKTNFEMDGQEEKQFKIHFTFSPGERQEQFYSGCPAEVEIFKIFQGDKELNLKEAAQFVTEYGILSLDELCFNAVEDERQSYIEQKADYEYEQEKDRRMGL